MADGDESDDVSDVNPDELAKMMEVRFKIVFFVKLSILHKGKALLLHYYYEVRISVLMLISCTD